MRQYLVAMGIRTAAFPLAVWGFMTERYALAWVAALLAIVIPSFAVMLANAVDHRQHAQSARPRSPVRQLGAATGPPRPPTGRDGAGEVLQGEVVQGEVVGGPVAAEPTSTSGDEPAGVSRS